MEITRPQLRLNTDLHTYRRWKRTAALMCGAALMISVLPADAKPRAQTLAAKQCKATYEGELARVRSLQLTAAERDARVNAAYENFAACLKANHSLRMLPKRPMPTVATSANPNGTAIHSRTSAAPSPTPTPKRTPWMSHSAPQTGTHL